jgi:DnaJ-class molecular chaperone
MSYQKCPICSGSGTEIYISENVLCRTCKGLRIINEQTGLPPSQEKVVPDMKDWIGPEVGNFMKKAGEIFTKK